MSLTINARAVSVGDVAICKHLLEESSAVSAATVADVAVAGLMDSNGFQYDEKVLGVFHYVQDNHLQGFKITGYGIRDFFAKLKWQDIKKLEENKVFADEFAQRLADLAQQNDRVSFHFLGYSGRKFSEVVSRSTLQRTAKIYLAYEYLSSLDQSETSYSPEEFVTLAHIEGLEPKTFSPLYRIDSRKPTEVVSAKGFYPNPARKRGILVEHSMPGIGSHGAGFISTSQVPGNKFNIKIGPVMINAKLQSADMSEIERMFGKPSAETLKSIGEGKPLQILKTYEYQITSALGVEPAFDSLIPGEREVVVPSIDANQITWYREIYILAAVENDRFGAISDIKYILSRLGSWAPVDH